LATQAGAVAELFVDTTKDTVVVMDGSTQGGFPLAKESALQSLLNTPTLNGNVSIANLRGVTSDFSFAYFDDQGPSGWYVVLSSISNSNIAALTEGTSITLNFSTGSPLTVTVVSTYFNNSSGEFGIAWGTPAPPSGSSLVSIELPLISTMSVEGNVSLNRNAFFKAAPTETIRLSNYSAGQVDFDARQGSTFYFQSGSGRSDFTANFTNVRQQNGDVTDFTIIIDQDSISTCLPTSYIVNGFSEAYYPPIRWEEGKGPNDVTTSSTSVITFKLYRLINTWFLIGSVSNHLSS
jgi:hypothetical protein